ncbi:MAG: TonB-dependent receptor, partial [Sphingomonas sp.]
MKGIKPTMLASAAVFYAIAAPVSAQVVSTSQPTTADQPVAQELAASPAADAASADIVVTAQRRSESVQRVPIAITVVGEQQLQRQQILQVSDLNRSAPALEFSPPGQTPGSGGYIRGIGTNVSGSTAEGSVGLVVDGVPQGNVPQSALFDINRVEVLRGPQGTLFGQSVSAGVVNISSNAPKIGQWSGSAYGELADDGTAGSEYSRRIGRLIVNVPIGADAALRVAGHYDSIDGVAYNAATKQGSGRNDRGVRARLLWQPSSAFTFNLIADYNQVDTTNEPFLTVYKTNATQLTSVLANCGLTVGAANGDSCTPLTPFNHIVQYGVSGQADIQLGRHTLTWITAFRHQDQTQFQSIDGLPTTSLASSPFPNINYGGPGGYDTKRQFTQEIRLTSPTDQRLEYVAGAFYSRFTESRNYISNLQLPFLPFPINTTYRLTPIVESFAGFGNVTLNVTDALRFIAGGRFTHNEVTARRTTITGGAPGYYVSSSGVDNFSFRAGAQYDLAARLMVYGTVSRGFKGQTYNDNADLS